MIGRFGGVFVLEPMMFNFGGVSTEATGKHHVERLCGRGLEGESADKRQYQRS